MPDCVTATQVLGFEVVRLVHCDEPEVSITTPQDRTTDAADPGGATEMMMSEQQIGGQTLERDPALTAPDGLPVLQWLRTEFPEWNVRIERTTTTDGNERPLWIAEREGHHPQSALTAAKLHTRMADYLDREVRRNPSRN